MSIYRGAGGAGDAVADSSSEALLVRELAAEVQVDADAAAASALAASTSESNASTSATNAASSASAASTSATNAASSASSASTSATNAASSETSAAGSASTATTQAGIAATQATNAASSASAASTSATNAATSATSAASSATSATSSATSAAASYDSFDDRYLGVKTSAPTLDNDGNALLNGALYFDSTLAAMRYYNTATTTWTSIAATLSTEPVRHSVRPSLLLDFANTKTLDPRITFTRASTATFYDGKTVAKAEENLFLYSETINSWTKLSSTVVDNSGIAPNGATTASLLTSANATAGTGVSQTVAGITATVYTISAYVKANGANFVQIYWTSALSTQYVDFDLSAGTVSAGSYTGASITALANSWYRITATFTAATTTSGVFVIGLVDTNTAARGATFTGDGIKGLYIWGAQLEQRSSVTAYTPTTTAPITNYIPALQTAASGVARFEHNPITSESLGLLIEEQRTNLLTYSEQFDNASWTKNGQAGDTLLDSNVVIAPDGTLTADARISKSGTSTPYTTSSNISFTSGTSYTFSIYAKQKGFTVLCLFFGAPAFPDSGRTAWFDLQNKTTQTQAGVTASLVDVGNGWCRCSITATSDATISTNCGSLITPSLGSTGGIVGDGFSGIYIWGAQLEAGAFATSYIPTVASQVTRSADSASMTGTNFSSWYRADEGTLYGESGGKLGQSATDYLFTISDGTTNNRIQMASTSTLITFAVVSNNITVVASNFTATSSLPYKQAVTYKVNDFATTYSGNTPLTDSLGDVPVVNIAYLGSQPAGVSGSRNWNGTIKKLAYYPKRLTNAELQGLTTV